MQRANNSNLLPFDPKIERTLRRIRKKKKNVALVMGANDNNRNNQQWALRDYFKIVVNDNYSRIWRPIVDASNFELKPTLINMV